MLKGLNGRDALLITVETEDHYLATLQNIVNHATEGLDEVKIVPILLPQGTSFNEFLTTLRNEYRIDEFDLVVFDHTEDNFLPDLKNLEIRSFLHSGSKVLIDNAKRKKAQLTEYLKYTSKSPYTSEITDIQQPYPDQVVVSEYAPGRTHEEL